MTPPQNSSIDPTQYEVSPEARQRLADGASPAASTSNLSVTEFLLVRQAGFRPLGFVHLRVPGGTPEDRSAVPQTGQDVESQQFTQAVSDAREIAGPSDRTDPQSRWAFCFAVSTRRAAAFTRARNDALWVAADTSAPVIVAACPASTVSTMSPPARTKSTARAATE